MIKVRTEIFLLELLALMLAGIIGWASKSDDETAQQQIETCHVHGMRSGWETEHNSAGKIITKVTSWFCVDDARRVYWFGLNK